MTDYSELVKALRHCSNNEPKNGDCFDCPYDGKVCHTMLSNAAAAIEVKRLEPKRGEWYEELFDGDKKYQCSNCLTHWDVETRYCPFCGAKMEVQK